MRSEEFDSRGRLIRSIAASREFRDGQGWLTTVGFSEDDGVTAYEYGPFGELSEVRERNRHVTRMRHDPYGRKVELVDPDQGRFQVLRQRLQRPRARDRSERPRDPIFVRQAGPRDLARRFRRGDHMDLRRDRARDRRLAYQSSPDGHVERRFYDPSGRLSKVSTYLKGANTANTFGPPIGYHVTLEYDAQGRLSRVGYPPSGSVPFAVGYRYAPTGHLQHLVDPIATPEQRYWTAAATDAAGRLTAEELGNRLRIDRTYDAVGRPATIKTTRSVVQPIRSVLPPALVSHPSPWPPAVLQDLTYDYDAAGRLEYQRDGVWNQVERYHYDDLNQLTSVTDPDGVFTHLEIEYDTLGNIRYKSDAGDYKYDLPGPNMLPHLVRKTVASTRPSYTGSPGRNVQFGYDANGNIKTYGQLTYEYTPFNLPRRVLGGKDGTFRFEYDAAQRRVRRSRPDATVEYVLGLYERQKTVAPFQVGAELVPDYAGELHHYFLHAAGRTVAAVVRVATIDSVGQHGFREHKLYFHDDHLGSVVLVTDASGGKVEDRAFDAFGRPRQQNWGGYLTSPWWTRNTIGFNAGEEEVELGLLNLRGRIYDALLGRFLTPDPFVQAPHYSQSLNRYAYAWNNPTTNCDPSGHFCIGFLCIALPSESEPSSPVTVVPYEDLRDVGNVGSADDRSVGDHGGARGGGNSGGGSTTYIGPVGVPTVANDAQPRLSQGPASAVPVWDPGRDTNPSSVDALFGNARSLLSLYPPAGWALLTVDAGDAMLRSGTVSKEIIAQVAIAAVIHLDGGQILGTVTGAPIVREADLAAQMLVAEGNQLSYGRAAITAQVVQDIGGDISILGAVTGNTRGIPGPIARGLDIALSLEDRAEELGFKAIFEAGGHLPDLHSEGIHQVLARELELRPLSPTYTNKLFCGPQCAAAQTAIDTVILEFKAH